MDRSEFIKWLLWGGPPAGGVTLRWLWRRRSEPPRPFFPLRVVRWSMQVATSAGRLAYTEQTLDNAKAALAARASDVAEAQAEIDRLRTENARLRRLLASSSGSDDGSRSAPIASAGAKPLTKPSPAKRRRSRASPAGSPPAISSPTTCAARSDERSGRDARADP